NKDSVDSLHSEVVHLNALVNDLHELSLTDMGALVYEKKQINLSEILEQSFDMHQVQAKKMDLRLNLRIQSSSPGNQLNMLGDPNRLQQLFDNLLQNTCRYTEAGGELQVIARDVGTSTIV